VARKVAIRDDRMVGTDGPCSCFRAGICRSVRRWLTWPRLASTASATAWKGVGTLVKEQDGRRYLFAANSTFDPAEVTWKGFGDVTCLRAPARNSPAPGIYWFRRIRDEGIKSAVQGFRAKGS